MLWVKAACSGGLLCLGRQLSSAHCSPVDALLTGLDRSTACSSSGMLLPACRCITFYVGKDRTPMRLVPLLCNYVADLKEANMLLNVKNWPSAHCDIHTNLEVSRFDDPDAVGEVRTEKKMRRVRSLTQQYRNTCMAAWHAMALTQCVRTDCHIASTGICQSRHHSCSVASAGAAGHQAGAAAWHSCRQEDSQVPHEQVVPPGHGRGVTLMALSCTNRHSECKL